MSATNPCTADQHQHCPGAVILQLQVYPGIKDITRSHMEPCDCDCHATHQAR